MKQKKHCLFHIPAPKGGISGHTAFYCDVNEIIIISNNDVLGDKWYIAEPFAGEGNKTKWYSSPTQAAIAYYDSHIRILVN